VGDDKRRNAVGVSRNDPTGEIEGADTNDPTGEIEGADTPDIAKACAVVRHHTGAA
jgi:hypothetical protein